MRLRSAVSPSTPTNVGSQPTLAGAVSILIVDDEPRNLTVLESVLDNPRYRLVRATTADQALLALLAEEFAVLILDVQMPGITGFELAQMIKDRKKTSQIPIIFLSAHYNEDQHVLEGYDSGAVDYLHKPINPAILRSKVAVLVELYLNQRLLEEANQMLTDEVAERRRAQEQLRELNGTLELRVKERTEAHVQAEQQIRFLMDEVNHRSKNLLSVVIAIAQQTVASDPREFTQRFADRLHALAVSHDLLVKSQWTSIQLEVLVRGQLAHFKDLIDDKVRIKGPAVRLTVGAAQTIGMVIHELSTNAAKHGALSDGSGRVQISWIVKKCCLTERFEMEWIESSAKACFEPVHKGFGTTVLTRMAAMSLGGEANVDYKTSGLEWRLSCPAKGVLVSDIAILPDASV